jgi:hypothetical protein
MPSVMGHTRRLALCGVVLALAACGSSGGGTLTKAQYDAKLSRLCLVASDQFRELHLGNDVAGWKHDAQEITRIEHSFQTKLAALSPPDSIKAAVDEYTAANDKVTQETLAAVAAAKAGDAAKLHALINRANSDSLATWPAAKKIGAKGCYIG